MKCPVFPQRANCSFLVETAGACTEVLIPFIPFIPRTHVPGLVSYKYMRTCCPVVGVALH